MEKLRLLVTTKCPNKCPMCCNNSWDFSKLPVVEHFNYKEIMITGGEPLLFPENWQIWLKVSKPFKNWPMAIKENYFYIRHWLICSPIISDTSMELFTLHILLMMFIVYWRPIIFLLDYKDELMESKSLRLNLFPDIKKHIPDNTDLSLWKVKDMKWIKDCPVPADEEFKRVAELWEVE